MASVCRSLTCCPAPCNDHSRVVAGQTRQSGRRLAAHGGLSRQSIPAGLTSAPRPPAGQVQPGLRGGHQRVHLDLGRDAAASLPANPFRCGAVVRRSLTWAGDGRGRCRPPRHRPSAVAARIPAKFWTKSRPTSCRRQNNRTAATAPDQLAGRIRCKLSPLMARRSWPWLRRVPHVRYRGRARHSGCAEAGFHNHFDRADPIRTGRAWPGPLPPPARAGTICS